jgi:hypothetical protein
MAVVYKHIRLDTNEVFNIGIGGEDNRSDSHSSRNPSWHDIVAKYGFRTEIIATDLNWDDARHLEMQLIEEYGRMDLGTGCLVNRSNGGEGKHPVDEIRYPPYYKNVQELKAALPQWWHDGCGRTPTDFTTKFYHFKSDYPELF